MAVHCFLSLTVCVILLYQTECGVEPGEFEMFNFFYNHGTQSFLAVTYDPELMKCYVLALTENEKLAVHTDEGIRALEVKLMGNLPNAAQTTPGELNPMDVKSCDSRGHNRTVVLYKI